ncbi:MRGBP protein, partial [Atractosteus spatula]|nr:MRGBP protein [Atractosteus spatula]
MGEAEAVPADEKQADSGSSPVEESVIWSQEVEVCLFHAMLGHKPVGVNRHFHMICIRDKFSQNIGRQVSSKVIWDHLGTMYDMQALHESEILPFPNSEKSFVLPEEIIQEVKEEKSFVLPEEIIQEVKEEYVLSLVLCWHAGKLVVEEEVKDEIKEERDPPATMEEGSNSSVKMAERANSKDKEKDKEKGSGETTSKEAAEKRKRNRVTEKVLNANSNPSSPSGAKRRRT